MTEAEQFEDLYGPQAEFSEFSRGDRVTYRYEGRHHQGEILWVCAAHIGSRQQRIPAHYIVARDGAGNSFPDIVFFNDVVIDS